MKDDVCWLCGNKHKMVETPYPWDGVRCPYDPTGKSKLPEKWAEWAFARLGLDPIKLSKEGKWS